MKKLFLSALSVGFALLVTNSPAYAGVDDMRTARLGNEAVQKAASHFDPGNTPNAGTIASSTGRIRGLRKFQLSTSSSWDWTDYDATSHPCAVFNVDAQQLLDNLVNFPGVPGSDEFNTDATLTFSRLRKDGPSAGDQIVGHVTSGVNCEVGGIVSCSGGGFGVINEGTVSFVLDAGTGEYAKWLSGSGVLRTRLDTCTNEFTANDLSLRLSKDATLQE